MLKLRNLYKWEHGMDPWEEPESADLLEWIEARENFWQTLTQETYGDLPMDSHAVAPWETAQINNLLAGTNLVYGSGYGRSMKAIFFLAEKIREESVEGSPVLILGRETASSPFAANRCASSSGTISRTSAPPAVPPCTMPWTSTGCSATAG